MKYFEQYYPGVDLTSGSEVKVLCPFHDDHRPTASINTDKSLFHCFACNIGYNEAQFISKVNGISLRDALKLVDKNNSNTTDFMMVEKAQLWSNNAFIGQVEALGISRKMINDLALGMVRDDQNRMYLAIPVYYDGVLVDVRRYNLLKIPGVAKMYALKGAENGFVFPYDLWKKDTRTTYLFEGEKDTMLARELGLNAITLTGGAGALPNSYVISQFKDRDVIICYDNDDAGKEGRQGVFEEIRGLVNSVKYVDIADILDEPKADFYDLIHKGFTLDDFLRLQPKSFTVENQKKHYVSLSDALLNNTVRKELRTIITVSGEFQDSYATPTAVKLWKTNSVSDSDTMFPGEERMWFMEDYRVDEILELIEADAKSSQALAKLKQFAGIPKGEKGIASEIMEYATVYKSRILDDSETKKTEELSNLTVDLYSFIPLSVGNKYEVVYRLFPHPTKHQKLIAMATKVVDLTAKEDFVPNKELLKHFQSTGTIDEQVRRLYKSSKYYVAKHMKYFLWFMIDLVFNSILEFNYGDRIRGALDVFILGDTQVGKSETSSKLTELYNFGHFLSLKTSTTVGLIGGSNKVDNNWLNTIGAIPRQHRRLVVMEEFSGAKPEFIKTMTDIRSSGRVRLARAAGELDVPSLLRMITISNPINDDNGNPRFLSTFPNGVMPLMELIKSAEDVARYDGFLLAQKPDELFNPFSLKLEGEKIPKEAYEHKSQWVYTRRPEDVIFKDDSDSYIWDKAQELNQMFESNFPLFGTTTALKLARFSVALASLIMSTDEEYSQVIVTKDIVDYMFNYFIKIYKNDIFKLHDYKREYDSYSLVTDDDVRELQKMYPKNATLFDFLESQSTTSRTNLRTISGIENDQFYTLFNNMTKLKFIRLVGDNVYPTKKFRTAMNKIDKNFRADLDSMITEKTGKLELKGEL
jgi:hypothetical protein